MNEEMKRKILYIQTTFEIENIYLNIDKIKEIITEGKIKEKNMKKIKRKYEKWEDYLIEGTNTLKNIPNIQNKDLLIEYEKQVTTERLSELYDEPIIGNFDTNHLYKIHEYLFQDIYDWAGETRTVPMMKQTVFLEPQKIEPFVTTVLKEAITEIKKVKDEYHLASCLSTLFYSLTFAHPFREGNGRTIREFIRQLVKSIDFGFGSYEIDYSKINQQTIAMGINCSAPMFITPEFQKSLTKRNNKQKVLK